MNRWLVPALLLMAGFAAAQSQPPVFPAAALTDDWTSVALPATPLHVTEHDGSLWVCGEDEMIARSGDHGETWQVLHENDKGAFLFALTFGEGGEVDAYGTDGAHLVSSDDGAKWEHKDFPDVLDLMSVQMFPSGTGYGMAVKGFAVSHDFGRHWKFNNARVTDPTMLALATLDDQHAALLDSVSKGGNHLKWTDDGGRSWKSATLPKDETWTDLTAESGAYVLYGASKEGLPITARQDSSGKWTIHSETVSLTGCTVQGCLVDGGWLDNRSGTPQYWALPKDVEQPLTHTWAAEGDTFCRVSSTLRCRRGMQTITPPPAFANKPKDLPHCGRCTNPGFPRDARRHDGVVVATVLLKSDGTFQQVLLAAASSAGQAREAMKTLATWKMDPAQPGGTIPPRESQVEVTFQIFN